MILSPLDSRYEKSTLISRGNFSDFVVTKTRFEVEIRYLLRFAESIRHTISGEDRKALTEFEFTEESYNSIKRIEIDTKHDVKALEYYIQTDVLPSLGMEDLAWMVHFGLTSQDIVDTSMTVCMKRFVGDIYGRLIGKDGIIENILLKAKANFNPIMTRTHGQPATPSSVHNQLMVYYFRIRQTLDEIKTCVLYAKFGGSDGNLTSLRMIYPDVNWNNEADNLVQSFDLERVIYSTQVNNNDSKASLFHAFIRLNNAMIDLCRDIWYYMSLGNASMVRDSGYVGSSVMAHKSNPIEFENAEGNLELANANLGFLADKLTKSRLQRDLSDTTVYRNIGHIFGYCELAYESLNKGLSKLAFDPISMSMEMEGNYQIMSEYVQLYLKSKGYGSQIFEDVKNEFRGKKMDRQAYVDALDNIVLNKEDRDHLLKDTITNKYRITK